MNRLGWWLMDLVSGLLQPDERDAVRGDLAEAGETGLQALRELLGLVFRRQATLWSDWRTWLTLVALIVPLGMLLSIISKTTSDQNATYIWMYANNWDWALLKYAGFWYEFAESVAFVFARCLTLACWSWTAGFVLGSTSRRIAQVYGVLFCLVLVFGALWGAPEYLAYLLQSRHVPLSSNGGASAVAFYRNVFPLIVQAVLVAAPVLWGMRQGGLVERFAPSLRIVLWSVAIVTLTAAVIQEPGFGFFVGHGRQLRSLSLIVYWPLVYLIASAMWRRRHGRIAAI
jgi:hypothetical protein